MDLCTGICGEGEEERSLGSVALPAAFSSLPPPLWALKEALLILGRPFLCSFGRESRCRHDTHRESTARCGWGSPRSSYCRFKAVP